jgi:hypothetical protein
MHNGRGYSMRMMYLSKLVSWIAAGAWLGTVVAPSQQTTDLNPSLQLDKPIYSADESVRFWVGVTSASETPEALRTACFLHWIRPDGLRLDEQVPWPLDGDSSRGWQGGWGFGKQPVSLGGYVVSFECAGQKTLEQTFEIVANPLSGGIRAQWILVDTKSGGGIHARSAFLHVENGTGRVLRFAKPGLIGSEVSLQVKTLRPSSLESTLVSDSAILRADEIPSFSFQKLEWSNQSKWPMIAVPPGGAADRTVDLQSAYPFRNEQEYEVTLSAVLTIFVGEHEDPDAALFPMRIPVSTTAHFRW